MNKKPLQSEESGFSLMELLVAVVIFSVVTGAAFSLLNEALKGSNFSEQQVEAQQNLRTAQEYVTRDLYNTADGLRGLNPTIRQEFVLNYLSRDIVAYPPPASGGSAPDPNFVPAGMIMTDNEVEPSTAVLGTTAGTTVLEGTDRLTLLTIPDIGSTFNDIDSDPIRDSSGKSIHRGAGRSEMYVSTANGALIKKGEIYLLLNATASAINPAFVTVTENPVTQNGRSIITFGTTNDYFLNNGTVNTVASSNETPLTLKRVWIIHYFVDNNKRLIRRVFGQRDASAGNPFTDNIIAEHVTQLEFRHILRKVNQATGKTFPPEIVEQINNKTEQDSVRQVEIAIGTETVRQVVKNPRMVDNRRVDASTVTTTSPRNLQFFGSLQPTGQQ